jgi:hypothetical protein
MLVNYAAQNPQSCPSFCECISHDIQSKAFPITTFPLFPCIDLNVHHFAKKSPMK